MLTITEISNQIVSIAADGDGSLVRHRHMRAAVEARTGKRIVGSDYSAALDNLGNQIIRVRGVRGGVMLA
jgi:hypothetical protein